MKKYALMAAALVMIAALLIAGCSHKSGGSSTSGVAEINGQTITFEDFAKQISQDQMMAQFVGQALSKMLEDRLVVSLAEKNGVPPTDEQINQRIDLLKKTADLDSQLKQAGLSMDDVKAQIKLQQARINLAEKLVQTKVTDDEVKAQYDRSKSVLYDMPERMRVQMMVFSGKAAADKASKDLEGGATMEKIGETQTQDHSAVLTQVIPKSGPGLPPDIAKAAFDTPQGKTSKPVVIPSPQTPGQTTKQPDRYLIMKPLEKLPPVKVSEQEAAPIIRGQMYLQKSATDKDFEKAMNDARRDAKITVNMPQFKQVAVEFHKPPQPQGMGGMMPQGAMPMRKK
jgi:parvulin-like peptidyl-prolyl isomerase